MSNMSIFSHCNPEKWLKKMKMTYALQMFALPRKKKITLPKYLTTRRHHPKQFKQFKQKPHL